ncbi:GNAT family N-acetyltransferase [Desulfuromonas sp. CSMB_57]|uniref:GNAT family N-acetyltransferase n=1 Tax=Desulfuromonas sp. CSMB_57 TaxID=2807629 RepID=UPI001CD7E5D6|nr:GNAT family N-acetyltransferase [Desulfuromonas sp. CSMB_57]
MYTASQGGVRCGLKKLMESLVFKTPEKHHWREIARLIADSIPNSIVSHLGVPFAALYYEHIAKKPLSCCYAVFDAMNNLAGVSIATLDRTQSRKLTLILKVKLFCAANVRILSLKTIHWILSGFFNIDETNNNEKGFPKAELMVIAIAPQYRGQHLSRRFLEKIEKFFKENNVNNTYLILTEYSNLKANRLYGRIGAKFIKTNTYHGKKINEWHKSLA